MITKEAILNRTPRNPADNMFIHESDVEQAMDEYGKDMATGFLEWMFNNTWVNNKIINQDGHFWFKQYVRPQNRELKTTEQLFNLYLKETQGV